MKLTLTEKKPETSDVTSFIFQPDQPLAWQAGQFLHYSLPHPSPDDRHDERWFTISSAPFESHITMTTRFAVDKNSTFKIALFNLPIGAKIDADNPEGDFTLNDPNQEYVFIAGGIGITPFRSILKDLDHKGLTPKITLFYANRNDEYVFKQELEEIAARNSNFKIVYITAPQRIDAEYIKQQLPDFSKPIIYLSGPEPMVESLGDSLKQIGVPENHLKQDFFPGYPAD